MLSPRIRRYRGSLNSVDVYPGHGQSVRNEVEGVELEVDISSGVIPFQKNDGCTHLVLIRQHSEQYIEEIGG